MNSVEAHVYIQAFMSMRKLQAVLKAVLRWASACLEERVSGADTCGERGNDIICRWMSKTDVALKHEAHISLQGPVMMSNS